MSEWKETTISEIVTLISGGTPKTSVSEYWSGNIPWLSVVDFNNGKKYVFDTEKKITKEGLENSSTKLLEKGDIIISARGTVGVVAMLGKQMAFNQSCYGIRANENSSNGYVYYLLKDRISNFLQYSHGGVFDTITKDTFKEIEILLPPLQEQKAIASVLSSIDDKIDLLHRQNVTLEKMAETLFRQWFVEFSENKGEETYESELGQIPISVNIDQIKNLNHILESGKRPKGGVGNLSTGIPSVGAESIKGLGVFDYSKTKFVSEEFAGNMSKGFVNGYELLIYKDGGTPGHFIPRYSIFGAGFPFNKMVINEHVFKLDFGSKTYNFFMYYFFQIEITESILVANGAKAAIPGINQEDIRNLWVITPDNELIDSFGKITLPYLDKILSNCNQIRTLTTLRDTLLPKLMSGEVKIN